MSIDRLKRQLAGYARKMAEDKLVIGASGNLSARHGERFYIKAAGRHFKDIKKTDFIGLNIKNPKIEGLKKAPSCEYRLHAACYIKRPDIKAVFHAHPFFTGIVFSRSTRVKPVTMEFAAYISNAMTAIKFTPPGSSCLSRALALACCKKDCIVMKKHGIVTLGKSMQDAYVKSLIIEREARAQVIKNLLNIKNSAFSQKQIDALAGRV